MLSYHLAGLVLLAALPCYFSAPFGQNNVVVLRVGGTSASTGTGAAAVPLSNASAPVFLDEYTPGGVLVQSLLMPATITGMDLSSGFLSRSASGNFLTFGAVTAAAGTTTNCTNTNAFPSAPNGNTAANSCYPNIARAIVRVDAGGNAVLYSIPSSQYDGIISGACTYDGSGFWVVGNATAASGSNGIAYYTVATINISSIYVPPTPTWHKACSVGGPGAGNALYLTRHDTITYTEGSGYADVVLSNGVAGSPKTTSPLTLTSLNGASTTPYLDKGQSWGSYYPTAIVAATKTNTIFVSDLDSPFWTPQSANPGLYRLTMASTPITAAPSSLTYPYPSSVALFAANYVATGVALSMDETTIYFATPSVLFSSLSSTFNASFVVAAVANTEFRGVAIAPFVLCPLGSYAPSTGLALMSQCVACAAGTTTLAVGGTYCVACPVGAYCTGTGAPQYCPLGSYSGSVNQTSNTSCTACPVASTTNVTGATSIASCACNSNFVSVGSNASLVCSCPAGFATGGGASTSCSACAIGTFSVTANSASCGTCGAGTTTTTPGSSSCVACPTGGFCAAGVFAPCPIGTFSNQLGQMSVSSCSSCAAGSTTTFNGSSACSTCPAGSYCAGGTATPCPLGTFSTTSALMNSSGCTACPAGANTTVTGAAAATSCACSAGFTTAGSGSTLVCTCPAGFILTGFACVACGAGTFSASPNSATCTSCSVGTYAATAGMAACVACPPGAANALGVGASSCGLSPFGAGHLAVLRVGTGVTALTQTATPLFVDEYTTAGALVQSIALPVVVTGTDQFAGALSLAANGASITFGALSVPIGTAPGASCPSSGANLVPNSCYSNGTRSIVSVSAGGVPTVVNLTSAHYDGIISGVCTYDGTGFWVTGNSSVASGANAVSYAFPNGTISNIFSPATATSYKSCTIGGPNAGNAMYLTRHDTVTYSQGSGYLDIIVSNGIAGTPPPSTRSTFVDVQGDAGNGNDYLDRGASWGSYWPTSVAPAKLSNTLFVGDFDSPYWTPSSANPGIYKLTMAAPITAAPATLTYPYGSVALFKAALAITGVTLSVDETMLYYATTKTISVTPTSAFAATLLVTAPTNTEFRGMVMTPVLSCPLGSFNGLGYPLSSALQCSVCSPGFTTLAAGANSSAQCVACPSGSFCAGGPPTLCPANTYQSTPGAQSNTSCTACQQFSGSVPGSTSCACIAPYLPSGSGASLVCQCLAGNYMVGSGASSSCLACPVGTFAALQGALSCTTCTAGSTTNATGATSCSACPPGAYCPGGNATQCPLNTYNPLSGSSLSSACTACPTASTSTPSSTSCTCLPGYISSGSGATLQCTCAAGNVLAGSGVSATCTPCGQGLFSSTPNLVGACTPCAAGSYNAGLGATACKTCPPGSTNLTQVGSTNCGLMAFTQGNLAVLRVGTGAAPLGNVATSCFVDEYTTTGLLVQTIVMPATLTGTDMMAGFTSRSSNGGFLTFGGLSVAAGTVPGAGCPLEGQGGYDAVGNSCYSNSPRLIVRVDAGGNAVVVSIPATSYDGLISGVCSYDGSGYWIVGNATVASGSNGIAYATPAGAISSVFTPPTNTQFKACTIGGPVYGNTIYLTRRDTVTYSLGSGYADFVASPGTYGPPSSTKPLNDVNLNQGDGNDYLDRSYSWGSYWPSSIAAARLSNTLFIGDMMSPYWTPSSADPGIYKLTMPAATPITAAPATLNFPFPATSTGSTLFLSGNIVSGVALSADETMLYYSTPKALYSSPTAPATATGIVTIATAAPNTEFRAVVLVPFVFCALGTYSTSAYPLATQSQCTPCPAGQSTLSAGATSAAACVPCTAGSYCAGGTMMTQCPSGTFTATTGSSSCSGAQCLPGQYGPVGSTSAAAATCSGIACAAGSYGNVGVTASICTLCSAGTYSTSVGLPSCTPCPAGTYAASTGSSALSQCLACAAGSYATAGSAACTLCASGSFASSTGSASCAVCGANTYALAAGSTACTPCPTSSVSSAGASTCTCLQTFASNALTGGSLKCTCPNNYALVSSTTCTPPIATQSFTQGNLIVLRVGDGSAALSSSLAAQFLDEYQPLSGILVQSVPLGLAASGTDRGVASIARSATGRYLSIAGVGGVGPGLASTVTAPFFGPFSTLNVARVDVTGAVDISTTVSAAGGVIRAACSTDGSGYYLVGNATQGIQYLAHGSTAAVAPTSLYSATSDFVGCSVAPLTAGPSLLLLRSNAAGAFVAQLAGSPPSTTAALTLTQLNGGLNLAAFSTGSYSYFPTQVAAMQSGTTIFVSDLQSGTAPPNPGIWVSTNGGANFTIFATSYVATGLALSANEATLYFVAPGGIYSALTSCAVPCRTITTIALLSTASNMAWRGLALAPCAAGTSGFSCTTCPIGTFTTVGGMATCAACPAGQTTAAMGSSSCTCGANYTSMGTSGANLTCTACPAGSSSMPGAATCTCGSIWATYVPGSNACIQSPSNTPTPTSSMTSTPTPTSSTSSTPTPTISATNTPTPTISVTNTPSNTPTATVSLTGTPSPSTTASLSPTTTATPSTTASVTSVPDVLLQFSFAVAPILGLSFTTAIGTQRSVTQAIDSAFAKLLSVAQSTVTVTNVSDVATGTMAVPTFGRRLGAAAGSQGVTFYVSVNLGKVPTQQAVMVMQASLSALTPASPTFTGILSACAAASGLSTAALVVTPPSSAALVNAPSLVSAVAGSSSSSSSNAGQVVGTGVGAVIAVLVFVALCAWVGHSLYVHGALPCFRDYAKEARDAAAAKRMSRELEDAMSINPIGIRVGGIKALAEESARRAKENEALKQLLAEQARRSARASGGDLPVTAAAPPRAKRSFEPSAKA